MKKQQISTIVAIILAEGIMRPVWAGGLPLAELITEMMAAEHGSGAGVVGLVFGHGGSSPLTFSNLVAQC